MHTNWRDQESAFLREAPSWSNGIVSDLSTEQEMLDQREDNALHPSQLLIEWAYTSGKAYTDPFNEVELDVVVTDPDGQELTVPAFWAGDQTWRVRFAPRQIGQYTYRTVCSDAGNADLHGQTGTLMVARLHRRQPAAAPRLRCAWPPTAATWSMRDGTPFFWLGDTWWMGFTQRLSWPADFQQLTADRVAKGFSVVQIVAGLYPDMDWYDERGMNEAGFPWDEGLQPDQPGLLRHGRSAHRPPGATPASCRASSASGATSWISPARRC